MSVAAVQSEARATASLAGHLVVPQAPAKREVEKSVGNLAPKNLQPRPLPVSVRDRRERETHEREEKAPMVNLPGNQEADRQLPLSKGRGNPQRRRERGLHRPGHNNSC